MSSDRLEILYERASRLPGAARTAMLDELRQSDPGLAREIESLLDAGASARSFFDSLGKTLFSDPEGMSDPRDLIPAVDPLYGSHVGDYRIDTVIGRGGMGTVYKAIHQPTGEMRALKFLPAFAAASAEVRARFMAEAGVTRTVSHPNVGEVHEIAETEDGRLYLAMPFYPGTTLKVRLKTGALPPDETQDWLRQTAAGLRAVHGAGIIHRDLTPGNLIRDAEGIVKILDFGLAKASDVTLGTGNRPLGTLVYMAPEQLSAASVDHRADLWSLGVILYEMIWGQRPYRASTLTALARQMRDPAPIEIPTAREGVSPEMIELVRGLLSKDPAKRPGLEDLGGG